MFNVMYLLQRFFIGSLLIASGILSFTVSAQTVPKEMDLYLLIGQSNMAGRGKVEASSDVKSTGIWMITEKNEWVPARDPLHFDKPTVVGVGPGLAFAEEVSRKTPGRIIGLIPCAVGGSGIDDWVPGVKHEQTGIYAYDAMLLRVKEASKHGKIKGIIWHQGESDCSPAKSAVYYEKLSTFFKRLRKETGTKKTPLILGTLGDFIVAKNAEAAKINQIMKDYSASNKNTYVVTSSGLVHLGDNTHFDTKSAQELGRRYAEAFLSANGTK
jgi:hypothetical protein